MSSEFELIGKYFTRPATHSVLGAGDDGAIIQPGAGMQLVISTDMLVEGVHFLPGADAEALGWKTLAVNLSDMAAMGAQPRWVVLAAAIPAADENWIAAFARGFFACAERYGVDVIGGDTTRGPLTLAPTIFGEVTAGQSLLRSGAKVGDELWISGAPGYAALGLAHLQQRLTLKQPALKRCLDALHRPQPRVELGLALRGVASAAIDVSDGLLADLGHVLQQSGVGAELHETLLPLPALNEVDPALVRECVLAGGDDYELLFTAAPVQQAALKQIARTLKLPLNCIGVITATQAGSITLHETSGKAVPLEQRGFDHFK